MTACDASLSASGRRGLVVEDDARTRLWLVEALAAAFPGIAIAEAGTLAQARAQLRPGAAIPAEQGSHIVLIDIGLPDGSGLDLVRMLAERGPVWVPIVTTIYDDDRNLFEAISAGAQGYLLKDQPQDIFIQYLLRIDRGEPPLSPQVARRIMAHFAMPRAEALQPDAVKLTGREQEVLSLLGKGMRVGEAARILGLTPHTVAGYVKTIYRKLNVSSRAEAAVEAARRGLV